MGITVKNLNIKGNVVVGPTPSIIVPTWTLTFTGGQCGLINCATNTQTIPETVTLYFEKNTTAGVPPTVDIYKNNTLAFTMDGTYNNITLAFNINDTLYFIFTGLNSTGTLDIKQDNASGRLISNVPFYVFD